MILSLYNVIKFTLLDHDGAYDRNIKKFKYSLCGR